MPICKKRFNAKDAHVKTCDIDCCNADLKAECNKRPGWPGTKVSSAIHTNNYTGTINKGQRGVGARLTSSIWCLLLIVSLCVRIVVWWRLRGGENLVVERCGSHSDNRTVRNAKTLLGSLYLTEKLGSLERVVNVASIVASSGGQNKPFRSDCWN